MEEKLRKKERERQKLIRSVDNLRSKFEKAGEDDTQLGDLDVSFAIFFDAKIRLTF